MDKILRSKLRRNVKGEYFPVKYLEKEEINYLNTNYKTVENNVWKPITKSFKDLKFNKCKTAIIIGKGMSYDFLTLTDLIVKEGLREKDTNILFINETINNFYEPKHFIKNVLGHSNFYSLVFDYHLNDKVTNKLEETENINIRNYKQITGELNSAWYPYSYELNYGELFNLLKDSFPKLKLSLLLHNDLTVIKSLHIAKYFGAENIIFYGFDSCSGQTGFDTRYADSIDPSNFKEIKQNNRFKIHKELIEQTCSSLELKFEFELPQSYFKKPEILENSNIIHKINLIRTIQEPVVFLPYLGELGWLCMWHVHMVNQCNSKIKIVCCTEEEKIFYPSADFIFINKEDYNFPDKERSGTRHPLLFEKLKKFSSSRVFIPSNWLTGKDEHEIPDSFYSYKSLEFFPIEFPIFASKDPPKILLGPRYRERAEQRNWQYWQEVKDYLDSNELDYGIICNPEIVHPVFKDSYIPKTNDERIYLLQNCKLYIGNDSGPSHLAALCKTKSLIFRDTSLGDRTNRMQLVNPNIIRLKDSVAWIDANYVIENIEKVLTRE